MAIRGHKYRVLLVPLTPGQASTALFNLPFLNVYEAEMAPTEGEHRARLVAAGFKDVRKQTLDPDTIITVTLPG